MLIYEAKCNELNHGTIICFVINNYFSLNAVLFAF